MKALILTVSALAFITIGAAGAYASDCSEVINSGKEFGQHVRSHNDNFSGEMNPGVHHQGYSTKK